MKMQIWLPGAWAGNCKSRIVAGGLPHTLCPLTTESDVVLPESTVPGLIGAAPSGLWLSAVPACTASDFCNRWLRSCPLRSWPFDAVASEIGFRLCCRHQACSVRPPAKLGDLVHLLVWVVSNQLHETSSCVAHQTCNAPLCKHPGVRHLASSEHRHNLRFATSASGKGCSECHLILSRHLHGSARIPPANR